MAVVLLDNLPLPSLKSYTIGSLLLFVLVTIYGYNFNSEIADDNEQNVWQIITSCMAKDPFCTWTTVNMVYCGFFLIGKMIQRFVFGDLRPIELQHIKDKFWNFIFYKFIFIFGVLNVQQMNEAMLWCAWFTIIGFFQLFTQLCYDRFQYLCYSPSTTSLQHGKVVSLVAGVVFSCCALTGISLYVGQQKDIHVFFFLFCEISLLSLRVLHLATKYTIYLLDLKSNSTWQHQKTVTYYSDIGFDMTILVVDIVYHVYMLIYSNIFLSMASLVLCMQLRSLFHDIKHKLAKHRKIIRVRKIVERRFENASAELLEESSDNKCAICWEGMQKAKKLKCGHLFHSECLCSWLVHDSSCPTCRHSLEDEMKDPSEQGNRLPRRTLLRNHFFHFDGRQIATWFPSFSVEVLHTRVPTDTPQIPESRIDTMAHEVQAIFPHIPLHVIQADLSRTHSVDVTTDNILEGNIHIPAAAVWEESTETEQTLQALPSQTTSGDSSEDQQLVPELTNQEREERQSTVPEDPREEKEATESVGIEKTRTSERGTFGVDFAEQTDQRQTSLSDRKKQMLQSARKRFLEKS